MMQTSEHLPFIIQQPLLLIPQYIVLTDKLQRTHLAREITLAHIHLRKPTHPNTPVNLEIGDVDWAGRPNGEYWPQLQRAAAELGDHTDGLLGLVDPVVDV